MYKQLQQLDSARYRLITWPEQKTTPFPLVPSQTSSVIGEFKPNTGNTQAQ